MEATLKVPDKKSLRTDEAAAILGISERTVRRWEAKGVLDRAKPRPDRSPLRITADSVRRMIEEAG